MSKKTPKKPAPAKPKAEEMPTALQELTDKERLFVMFYVGRCRFNATRAALMAGYSANGTSAGEIGHQNLKKLHIREAVDTELRRMAVDYPTLRREVMAEYVKLAFSDMLTVADINKMLVSLKDGEELPPEVSAAIKRVTMTTSGVSIELHSKTAALDSLAKVLSLLSENPPKDGEHYEGMIERLEREERERIGKSKK